MTLHGHCHAGWCTRHVLKPETQVTMLMSCQLAFEYKPSRPASISWDSRTMPPHCFSPAALLSVARDYCAGPLSLLPLDVRHAELRVAPPARAAAAECVHEGVLEMLHML